MSPSVAPKITTSRLTHTVLYPPVIAVNLMHASISIDLKRSECQPVCGTYRGGCDFESHGQRNRLQARSTGQHAIRVIFVLVRLFYLFTHSARYRNIVVCSCTCLRDDTCMLLRIANICISFFFFSFFSYHSRIVWPFAVLIRATTLQGILTWIFIFQSPIQAPVPTAISDRHIAKKLSAIRTAWTVAIAQLRESAPVHRDSKDLIAKEVIQRYYLLRISVWQRLNRREPIENII